MNDKHREKWLDEIDQQINEELGHINGPKSPVMSHSRDFNNAIMLLIAYMPVDYDLSIRVKGDQPMVTLIILNESGLTIDIDAADKLSLPAAICQAWLQYRRIISEEKAIRSERADYFEELSAILKATGKIDVVNFDYYGGFEWVVRIKTEDYPHKGQSIKYADFMIINSEHGPDYWARKIIDGFTRGLWRDHTISFDSIPDDRHEAEGK